MAKVLPGAGRGDPPSGRPHEESLPHQERFGHLFDRFRFFGYGHGERAETNRSPTEVQAQSPQHGSIETVEAQLVDLVELEGCGGDFAREAAVGAHLRIVADACLLYTSPSPRDGLLSRMPSSA